MQTAGLGLPSIKGLPFLQQGFLLLIVAGYFVLIKSKFESFKHGHYIRVSCHCCLTGYCVMNM